MTTQLTPSGKTLLNQIGADVFDHEICSSYLDAFLTDPRHVMYLAVDEGIVVGMASGVEYRHPDKPPQRWINEVGVSSTDRRQGIGRRLVLALVDAARELGCVFAWLGTDVSNLAAQKCFGGVPRGADPHAFFLSEWHL